MRYYRVCCAWRAAVAVAALAPGAASVGQSAFETYGSAYRAVTMPATGPGSFRLAGGVLPDGRIVALTGRTVYVETGVGEGSFYDAARIDAGLLGGEGGGTDPAFVRVNTAGTIALGAGAGRPVLVFDAAALGAPGAPSELSRANAAVFDVPHYDAAWADDRRLAITAGDFGSPSRVTLLDTLSDPQSPVNPAVVANIGGASAGVAFDAGGRLYTGNGFDFAKGGSATGWIKAFESAEWEGGAPADFEASGTLVARALSATPLMFDAEGNLFAGGGDFAGGDFGYLAVIRESALLLALGGGGPADPSDPAQVRRLAPSGDPFAFHDAAYNHVTRELYVAHSDFFTGANTWYATVPGLGSAAVLAAGAWLARAGRRRHA